MTDPRTYTDEELDDALELAAEAAGQYAAEVAMYGDAGPGQGEANTWAAQVRAEATRRYRDRYRRPDAELIDHVGLF